jgi:HicB-like protein involved in pilus formation
MSYHDEIGNGQTSNDQSSGDQSSSDPEEERSFSGRFPVRLPRYLHRQLTEVAREQGVSLNQFVCTAAVMAAGGTSSKVDQAPPAGSDRVSKEEYARIWRSVWG